MPDGKLAGDRGRSDGELGSENCVLHRRPFLGMADVVLLWVHPPLSSQSVPQHRRPRGSPGTSASQVSDRSREEGTAFETRGPAGWAAWKKAVDRRKENTNLCRGAVATRREPDAVSGQRFPPLGDWAQRWGRENLSG